MHPRWASVAHLLDAEIEELAKGKAGNREQQVHLSISRAGLLAYGTYHVQGSEFDYHAAHALLGEEGIELLKRDGKSCIIRVALPGVEALEGAHPFFSVDDLRTRGDVPNLVNDFLEAWSFRLGQPGYQTRTLELDSCLFFRKRIPADYIVGIEYTGK
jgi:hypothetical protein